MRKRLRCALSGLLAVAMLVSLVPSAFAAQENGYHDPAEHWLTAVGRTNELDANAVVTHETFNCAACGKATSFLVYRTPEYTRDGLTAMNRNVKYSDGTLIDGEGHGNVNDGTPGADAFYTGYHWTKATCEACGTLNSNMGGSGYAYGRNVYWLYDCAAEFTETLPDSVSYEYADSRYHTKTTSGGTYCCFCYGTNRKTASALERHDLDTTIKPQLANQRFVVSDACALCGYARSEYVAAKAVIASYYGIADGQPHTLTVTDLSDGGVNAAVRYGTSADRCTMTSAPNYTEAGQYTVYYQITYTYEGESMTENGVAYVWLRETEDGACGCGCGDPDCGCQDRNCGGHCCNDACGHHFTLLDTVGATCYALGYDRYLCADCGTITKQNYTAALGHAWQGVLIREADCEMDGKLLNICSRCGEVEVTATPRGEHEYETYSVNPTCTGSGYTVRECAVCGDRQITDITDALPHDYKARVTPASCEMGGHTTHLCEGCGSSFITDYTSALGHTWDKGTPVTGASCTGEGMTEYRCVRCGYHRLEGDAASGHVPGDPATCSDPQLCTKCGAVVQKALGHDYEAAVTAPTCTGMGFTTYTCARCGDSYAGDYTDTAAHAYQAEVTAPTCTEMGWSTYTCPDCGDSYKGDYTDATGHTPGPWITDREPTTGAEGSRHQECVNCGAVLTSKALEKLYLTGTTDSHGEAVVGIYTIIVTDTATKNPVAGAAITLDTAGALSIKLPFSRLLDYAKQTTVTVLLTEGKAPVPEQAVSVTDKNANYCAGATDQGGQLTVPGTSGKTSGGGSATVGYEDAEGDRFTFTVQVEHFSTGRPVEGAAVSAGRTGNLTVTLPDGTDLDASHRITVSVTDHKQAPQNNVAVTVKNDLGRSERGKTNKDGKLTLPAADSGYTDETGTAVVGGYTVLVTDTAKAPVVKALVTLISGRGADRITVLLPSGRLLDGNDQTVVTVLRATASPVKGMNVRVEDVKENHAAKATDRAGQIAVPDKTGSAGEIVGTDTGDKDTSNTVNVDVADKKGKPIQDAEIAVDKQGSVSVILPDGFALDEDGPVTVTVTDNRGKPKSDVEVTVKDADGDAATGKTGENGAVTLPGEAHTAYIYGYSDGTVRPEGNMTRSEAAAIFARLLADRNGDKLTGYTRTGFPDVSRNAWYRPYVSYLEANNLIFGYPDGTFGGEDTISRAEFVVICVRYFEAVDGTGAVGTAGSVFTDVYSRYWAVPEIRTASARGWIYGYNDQTFRPDQDITRGEVCAVVNRMLGRKPDEAYIYRHLDELNTFSDLRNRHHWAYADIMEAANTHRTIRNADTEIWQ